MTSFIFEPLVRACLAAGAVGFCGMASAIVAVPGPTDYMFEGNCQDCATAAGTATFAVSATLTLSNYLPGADLADDHFVRFSYSGSNLLDPYIVKRNPVGGTSPWEHWFAGIDGNLTIGGAQQMNLHFGDGLEFTLDASGNWFTCGVKDGVYYAVPCSWQLNNDNGLGGFIGSAPVPEPGTYALMGAGLLGMAMRRRRNGAKR